MPGRIGLFIISRYAKSVCDEAGSPDRDRASLSTNSPVASGATGSSCDPLLRPVRAFDSKSAAAIQIVDLRV